MSEKISSFEFATNNAKFGGSSLTQNVSDSSKLVTRKGKAIKLQLQERNQSLVFEQKIDGKLIKRFEESLHLREKSENLQSAITHLQTKCDSHYQLSLLENGLCSHCLDSGKFGIICENTINYAINRETIASKQKFDDSETFRYYLDESEQKRKIENYLSNSTRKHKKVIDNSNGLKKDSLLLKNDNSISFETDNFLSNDEKDYYKQSFEILQNALKDASENERNEIELQIKFLQKERNIKRIDALPIFAKFGGLFVVFNNELVYLNKFNRLIGLKQISNDYSENINFSIIYSKSNEAYYQRRNKAIESKAKLENKLNELNKRLVRILQNDGKKREVIQRNEQGKFERVIIYGENYEKAELMKKHIAETQSKLDKLELFTKAKYDEISLVTSFDNKESYQITECKNDNHKFEIMLLKFRIYCQDNEFSQSDYSNFTFDNFDNYEKAENVKTELSRHLALFAYKNGYDKIALYELCTYLKFLPAKPREIFESIGSIKRQISKLKAKLNIPYKWLSENDVQSVKETFISQNDDTLESELSKALDFAKDNLFNNAKIERIETKKKATTNTRESLYLFAKDKPSFILKLFRSDSVKKIAKLEKELKELLLLPSDSLENE